MTQRLQLIYFLRWLLKAEDIQRERGSIMLVSYKTVMYIKILMSLLANWHSAGSLTGCATSTKINFHSHDVIHEQIKLSNDINITAFLCWRAFFQIQLWPKMCRLCQKIWKRLDLTRVTVLSSVTFPHLTAQLIGLLMSWGLTTIISYIIYFFLQNTHYSYIEEHLKKSYHGLIPNPSTF